MNFQQTLHLIQTLAGTGNPGAAGLGAVNGGAASQGDDGLAFLLQIQLSCLLHIGNGGIGGGFVIDSAVNPVFRQELFQRRCQPGFPDAASVTSRIEEMFFCSSTGSSP